MSKDKNQRWAVSTPSGYLWCVHTTRKDAIGAFRADWDSLDEFPWKRYYRQGFRCVKVWVYQEKRELNPIIRRRKEGHMMTVKDDDGSPWSLWVPPASERTP